MISSKDIKIDLKSKFPPREGVSGYVEKHYSHCDVCDTDYRYWQMGKLENGVLVLDEVDTSCPYCREQKSNFNLWQKSLSNRLKQDNNLLPKYKNASLGSFKCTTESQKQTIFKLDMFVTTKRYRNFVMLGIPSTGKTMLLSGAVNKLNELGTSAYYVRENDIYSYIKDGYSRLDGNKKYLDYLGKDVKVLAIDELCRSANTDTDKRILSEIIENRYSHELKTMIASNATLEEFTEYLGDHILRRLRLDVAFVNAHSWQPYKE